ncbi:hypothetical protein SPRG_02645 [Saprolegnia parasitica CBS 223.65]|uniref:Uncharacterized protein n=1 Tax=Saprolegnia parasitica (strain CBS 223.65) TaxID=695850 RepID=A0A067D1P0_SAPPC|nr:hypothetical protein SPRG_02645 [Saprolegnia parasitica CBS 223.65]KDO32952.1 hypothetical protein SPRG_02645 [Saprolegnia parasitica CBS 223.65]|eukprot:XP_012196599.1 hypothetical protein SPRG_02645 [Saprolegnia parasitica CBS 223.65]
MAGKTSYTKAPAAAVKKVLRARGKAKSTPAIDDPLPAADDSTIVGGDTAELTAASIDEVSPVVTKKKAKKSAVVVEEPAVWCDASVAKMFELRYKTELKDKFESKNNFQKNLATLSLAATLSVAMNRTFTAAQVNAKFARMRTKWLTSKSTVPSSTGNDASSGSLPMHYDVMLEYWSGNDDLQRERLLSSDDPVDLADDTGNADSDVMDLDDENERPDNANKKRKTCSETEDKTTGDRGGGKKTKSTGEAIEGGLVAVSNGLISLGQSLAPGCGAAQSNTTLDDVLDAIKAQSTTALAEQVSYLVDAIKSQTNTMQQLIQAIAKK